jgi:hypothetical protein
MVVDDDDFLNSSLVEYVEKNKGENGWYINKGYVWPENKNLLYKCYFFDQLCGTSLIVKNELYKADSVCIAHDIDIIKERFGSHLMVKTWLKNSKCSLKPLPVFGALYRIGNINAHSQSQGIFDIFMRPHLKRREYWQFFLSLLNVKPCTEKIKSDFSLF